ncbi:MAG: N-acetyltransferase family protein [Clostridia bacterium]
MENISIREFVMEDYSQLVRVYQEGIDTQIATFETKAPTMEKWISSHDLDCTIVAVHKKQVVGFATLSPFSKRHVYRGVGEISIYISKEFRGLGIGSTLMSKFIKITESNGYWTLLAKIFPENEPSLRLHKRHGFRVVGKLTKIGQTSQGEWKDNVFLERRSKKNGI